MTPLRPCPHRELIPGSLATPADLAAWTAAYAAETCARCATPLLVRPEPPPPLPELPAEVLAPLLVDGRAGALAAQRALDALGVGPELLPAVADLLASRPGTGPFWRRWWAGWRDGALVAAAPQR